MALNKYIFSVNVDFSQRELLNAVLQNLFQAPLIPIEGQVYYDSLYNVPHYWNENEWIPWERPIHRKYNSQAEMIADQQYQLKQFIYYDGTIYWEYLGTTNGDISDYNPFGQESDIYVPYTGATGNVDLGIFNITLNSVIFNDDNVAVAPRELAWNPDKNTLDLGMGLGGSVQQIGMETYYTPVKNQTGSLIPDGTFVMATGSLGNSGRITVAPAVTDGSINSRYMLGVTTHDILNGGDGLVTWFGEIRGFNTNTKAPVGETWVDGTVLWANPNIPGGFTNVEPAAPNLKISVAQVISAGNNGVIFVRPTLGMNLTDLHNVDAFNPNDKDLISYDFALGHWNSKSLGQLIGGTSTQFLKGDGSLDNNVYYLASNPSGFTSNAGTVTSISTDNGISGGPITVSGTISLTGQASSFHNLSTNGFVVRTGVNSILTREIVAGNGIEITNGDGISGDTIISLSESSYSFGEDSFTYSGSTEFTLSINVPYAVEVFLNGQRLVQNLDWTITNNVVTVTQPLDTDNPDEIVITYFYNTPDIVSPAITGSGTANFITKWNGSNSVTNSSIQDDGITVNLTSSEVLLSNIGTVTSEDEFLAYHVTEGIKRITGSNLLTAIGGASTGDLHDPVTIGTANGLSLLSQELSLGLASSGVTGALSGTDWNTFNSKIGGTIASGQIAFGTGNGTIGGDIDLIWDNLNKRFGIGLLNPDAAIDVFSNQFPVGSFKRETSLTGGSLSIISGVASGYSLRTISTGDMVDGFGGGIVFSIQDISSSSLIDSNIIGRIYARRDGADSRGSMQFFVTGSLATTPSITIRNSGNVGFATADPTEVVDVNGNIRIRSLTTTQGDFVQADANGVFNRRTAAQVLTQIGAAPISHTHNASQITSGTFGLGDYIFQNNLIINGQVYSPIYDKGNSGTGTVTFNWDDGNKQIITLTGNPTFVFSNPQSGGDYQIIITQDDLGGKSITWPTDIKWKGGITPTLTGVANSEDVVTISYNGTSYYAIFNGDFKTA